MDRHPVPADACYQDHSERGACSYPEGTSCLGNWLGVIADVGEDGDRVGEAERRRRQFIWAHHPDRGGDPAVFIAGLRLLDEEAGSPGPEPRPRVIVVAHRSWLVRLMIVMARRRHAEKSPSRVG